MTQGIAKVKINRALYDVESHNITRLESDGDGKPVVKITMGGV
jgi:hypothetical protein